MSFKAANTARNFSRLNGKTGHQPASTRKPPHPRETIGPIAIADIQPSPANPRKTFVGLEDLAESLRVHGLLEDLHVRPMGEKAHYVEGRGWLDVDYFELIDGERRYRAAKLAGLTKVQCKVRVMTDDEAAVARLISFDQKEGLPPSEHAAAYRERRAAGMTDEQIAAAVNKPLEHVRGLLAAAKLPAFGLAAMDRGELSPSIAALLGRIPGEEDRERATACVLLSETWPAGLGDKDLQDLREGKTPEQVISNAQTLTFREVRELITKFQVSLKGAPFRKALDLVDGVSTCDECPKRAGNAAAEDESYKSLRADTCLDPSCFRDKQTAWGKLALAKAEKAGQTVIVSAEAEKVFSGFSGDLPYHSPYVDLDKVCHYDDRQRTYGALLKGRDVETVLAIHPSTGRAHTLALRTAAAPVLKSEYQIEIGTAGRAGSSDRERKERAAQKRKQEIGRAAAFKALALVAAKMEAEFTQEPRLALSNYWEVLAEAVVDVAGADACHLVAKRRDLPSQGNADGYRQPVRDLLATLAAHKPAIAGLVAELLAAKKACHWGHPYFGAIGAEERDWWFTWGIEPKDLMAQAAAERKESKAAKKAGGTKAATKPAAATPASPPSPPPAEVGAHRPKAAFSAELRLEAIEDLNPAVARHLARKGVTTLGDVADRVRAQRAQLPDQDLAGAIYAALASVITRGHAGGAADVLVEYLQPLEDWGQGLRPPGPASEPESDEPDPTPLARIPGFQTEDARMLESFNLRTIADLEALLESASEGRDGVSLGLEELLYQTLKSKLGWKREALKPMVEPILAYLTLGGDTPVPTCKVCGCTAEDCRACIEATGRPCTWVTPRGEYSREPTDLCSRCFQEQQQRTKAEKSALAAADGGESIDDLRVTAAELKKASIVGRWDEPKLVANSVEVHPVYLAGKPYVVTATVATKPPGSAGKSLAWYCLPLVPHDEFAVQHPGVTIRTDPRDTSGGLKSLTAGGDHFATAVVVRRVWGTDTYVLGRTEDLRRLVDAKPAKKRGA